MSNRSGHVVSNSERSDWSCLRLWFFRHILRLRAETKDRTPRVGSLWHSAMEGYWGLAGDTHDLERGKIAVVAAAGEATGRVFGNDKLLKQKLAGTDSLLEAIEILRGHRAPTSGERDYAQEHEDLMADMELVLGMLTGYDKRYRDGDQGIAVLHSEEWMEAPTLAPSGHPSHRTPVGGIADKIIELNGQHWLWEHKAPSSAGGGIRSWCDRNDYKPQAPTYAYLAEKAMGLNLVGVVYDLALQRVPPVPEDYALSGSSPCHHCEKRKATVAHKEDHEKFDHEFVGTELTKQRPSGTTHATLIGAINHYGLDKSDYSEELWELSKLDDPYFHRELYRFHPDELGAVVGKELHAVSTPIRRAHDLEHEHRTEVLEAAKEGHEDLKQVLVDKVRTRAPLYPRSGDVCWRWNRACRYMTLCRYMTVEGLEGLVVEQPRSHEDTTTSDELAE